MRSSDKKASVTPPKLMREDLQALKMLARNAHERSLDDERSALTPHAVQMAKTCICGAICATWEDVPAACRALETLASLWLQR